jgi:hypothetical protein
VRLEAQLIPLPFNSTLAAHRGHFEGHLQARRSTPCKNTVWHAPSSLSSVQPRQRWLGAHGTASSLHPFCGTARLAVRRRPVPVQM